MATLYISEYTSTGWTSAGGLPVGQEPSQAVQAVAIPGTSAAFQAGTRFVRLHTDAICSIAFGATPSASTTTARMNANQTEYFGVVEGQKVAVVANT